MIEAATHTGICFALLAVLLPGFAAARGLLPTRSRFERWAFGAALSFAAAVSVCWYTAAAGKLWMAAYVWLGLSAGAIGWRIFLTSGFVGPIRPRPESPMPWAVVMLSAVVWLGMLGHHAFPPGWDPTFHSILAESVRRTGGLVSNWQPFEPIGVNYPLGPHALIASLSVVTGLSVHVVFSWLLILAGITLTGLTYTLARGVGQGRWASTIAMVLVALWAWRGSTEYAGWGGLPNLLGVDVIMGAAVLALCGRGRLARIVSGLMLGIVPAVHHHVAMAAVLVVIAIMLGAKWPKAPGWAFAVAMVAAGMGPVAWQLARLGALGDTGVASDAEPWMWPWEVGVAMGAGFCVAVAAGVVVRWRDVGSTRPMGAIMRAAAVFFAAYLLGDYGYRFIRWSIGLTPATLFTPSRFLTDATPLLAIVAAAGGVRWLPTSVRLRRAPWMMALVGAGVCLSLPNWAGVWLWQMPDRDDVTAWRWIEANTPADAVLCTRNRWAASVAWRRTLRTPVPISEPIGLLDYTEQGLRDRAQGHALYEVKDPTAVGPGERVNFRVPGGRRVVVWTPVIPRNYFVIDNWK
jgi:hypothetical protein